MRKSKRLLKNLTLMLILFSFVFAPMSVSKVMASGTELDLWHYFDGPDAETFLEYVDKFNEDYDSEIKVDVTFVAREDLMKQYTMGAMSGELPDLGMVDNPDMASFIKLGVYQDITDLVEDWGQLENFYEGPVASCIVDDKIWGLPHNSNCLALVYNKDMLEEADVEVPETWDELREAAKALTTDETYGFVIAMPKHEEGTFQFMPWLWSAGGDYDNLDSEESIRALTFLTDLIHDGSMPIDVINWAQADANSQFYSGKAAMQINGPWNMPVIDKQAPELNYGVALIPHDKEYASCLGGENFGVCAGAPREESFEFIKYILEPENLADFCERGGKIPPRRDAAELREVWTDHPIYSVFNEGMEGARPRGPHAQWPEISTPIVSAVHAALTGEATPEEALTEAASNVDEILAE